MGTLGTLAKTMNTLEVRGVYYGSIDGFPVTAFDKNIVPARFFDVLETMGYDVQETGGDFLTHEIRVDMETFNGLIELAMMEE